MDIEKVARIITLVKVIVYLIFVIVVYKTCGIITFNFLEPRINKMCKDKNKKSIEDLNEIERCRFDSVRDILQFGMSFIIDIIGFLLISKIW